jgi:hypothetical protein
VGFGLALRCLALSKLVGESFGRVKYSSGAAVPFSSFVFEVRPSVAPRWTSSQRELLQFKRCGADTGWGWEGGSIAAGACPLESKGRLCDVLPPGGPL